MGHATAAGEEALGLTRVDERGLWRFLLLLLLLFAGHYLVAKRWVILERLFTVPGPCRPITFVFVLWFLVHCHCHCHWCCLLVGSVVVGAYEHTDTTQVTRGQRIQRKCWDLVCLSYHLCRRQLTDRRIKLLLFNRI